MRSSSLRLAAALAVITLGCVTATAAAGQDSRQQADALSIVALPTLQLPAGDVEPATFGHGTPGNLLYHGGRVLTSPRIYLIFWHWSDHSDPVARRLINFFAGAGGSGWAGVTTQYWQGSRRHKQHVHNPAKILAGVWFDDATPIHDNLSHGEIADEAARAVSHFGRRDRQALYMVATPSYANDAGFNQRQYCAWHSFTTPGIAFSSQPYIPNLGAGCGAHLVNKGPVGRYDGVTMAGGHEYLEAVTDPVTSGPRGWTDLTGQENADKCAYVTRGKGVVHNVHWSTGTFAVQTSWSNRASHGLGACAG